MGSLLFYILQIDATVTHRWPWQPCVYVHRRCVNTVPIHTNLKYQSQTTVTSLQQHCLLSVSLLIFHPFFFPFLHVILFSRFSFKTRLCKQSSDISACVFVCPVSLSHLHFPRRICSAYFGVGTLARLRPRQPWTCYCVLFTQTCSERSILLLNSFRS